MIIIYESGTEIFHAISGLTMVNTDMYTDK
jgi:hypothetical protein